MCGVENPMVIDSIWRENEPKVFGVCDGCFDDIYEGQEILEFSDGLVHDDSECCKQYVSSISVIKIAGE